MPFAELVDLDKEIERLTKEEEKLKKELARSEGMLSNEKFVSRAPEAKIAEEREKLEKYRADDGTGTGAPGTAAEIVEYEVKGRIERST